MRARSEGDHNRAALERVERRLAQLEGGIGRATESLKDPLVAAAERLSTRDQRYAPAPSPNGHYDARGPRGTPNGHGASPNGHYDARGPPNGHSPSNGYAPRDDAGYARPPTGEAPPRFLTPADVPNGPTGGFRGV